MEVEYSTELTSFSQNDEHVSVTLTKRSPSAQETTENLNVPYLVSAEGAHSIVRKGLPLSFLGETTTQKFVLADIEILEGLNYEVFPLRFDPDRMHLGTNLFIHPSESSLVRDPRKANVGSLCSQ